MREQKVLSFFKSIVMLFILAFLAYATINLWAYSFSDNLYTFLNKAYKLNLFEALSANKTLLFTYWFLKALCPLLLVWGSYRYIRFLRYGKAIFINGEDRIFGILPAAIFRNRAYIMNLSSTVRMGLIVLLLIQFTGLLYLSITIPYHYDEAWSYNFFCGISVISAITYYPVPNNHVFFNVIAYFFQLLPVDEIIAIRLPSIIATVFATYYFFKLLGRPFTQGLSLFLATIFAFLFAILFYGAQARGYAMLVFFSVICLYCFVEIVYRNKLSRYLWLYAISAVLGFFTIPSFLYFYIVVNIILGCFFLLEREYRNLIKFLVSSAVTGMLTFLLYLPIISFDGLGSLTENNGVIKRDFNFIVSNLPAHLEGVWAFISGSYKIPLYVALVLILFSFINKYLDGKRYIALLCTTMLLSPIPIVLVHKAIPFDRTWIFLCLPVIIALGITLERIFFFLRESKSRIPAFIVIVPVIIYGVSMTWLYKHQREKGYKVDYVVKDYMKIIGPGIQKTRSISTAGDFSFYLADDLQFETVRSGSMGRASITPLQEGTEPTSDIIVLGKETELKWSLGEYTYLPYENEFFRVYIRKGL